MEINFNDKYSRIKGIITKLDIKVITSNDLRNVTLLLQEHIMRLIWGGEQKLVVKGWKFLTRVPRIEDSKVCRSVPSTGGRGPFCMRLRKRRGGLPVARPQTPHVPSCRLKPGTPRALVCVLKTHGKSREFTRTANRDRRDGGRKWVMVMARGKINSRTYPGSNTRPYRAGKTWVTTVVGNKTVFYHEISVQLRRLRIKSPYESHVIDVVDFNDGRDFHTTREIRHYADLSVFVSGFGPFTTRSLY